MQILVGFGFNSNEHLEGQLVHEERIQSTATDKISTVTFQYLTELIHPSANLGSVISVVTKGNVIHVRNH